MTTEATPAPKRPAKRPGAWPVAAATLGTFLVVVAVLAVQLRRGNDPALGAGTPSAAPAPKRVLVKRVIKRVVVTRVVPAPVQSGGGGLGARGGAAPAALAVQAPARSPLAAAPAPAPAAPAPAPAAPAPVTRSS